VRLFRNLLISTMTIVGVLTLGISAAQASVTFLPRVAIPAHCIGSDTYGTMWAQFIRDDATGRRAPYQGGWTADYEYTTTRLQTIGIVGSSAFTNGTQYYNPPVRAASQLVPLHGFATRDQVSLQVSITIVKSGRSSDCVINIASN
jgi:hypothetical protein